MLVWFCSMLIYEPPPYVMCKPWLLCLLLLGSEMRHIEPAHILTQLSSEEKQRANIFVFPDPHRNILVERNI